MKARILITMLASAFVLTAVVVAAEKINLEGVKCVVNGKGAAKAGTGVDYKGGEVFFCCNNCPKAFKANREKFAVGANHQLVATKQAKQGACPMSGRDLDPETKLTVAGADVTFCCNNCKGAVAKLEGKAQLEKVFSEAAWKKAKFEVPKKKKDA